MPVASSAITRVYTLPAARAALVLTIADSTCDAASANSTICAVVRWRSNSTATEIVGKNTNAPKPPTSRRWRSVITSL